MNKYSFGYKHPAMFFDVPDDAGGDGGEPSAPEQQQQEVDSSPALQQAQAGPSVDHAALARELHQLTQSSQPAAPQRPPTPEELAQLRKELKIWDPTDEWTTKFDNMDTRKKAIEEMRDGLFAQSFEAARRYYAEREQGLMQQFQPVLSAYQQQQEEKVMSEMTKAYPALEPLRPIVDKVIAHFHMQKTTFASKEELFKAVASNVEQVMRVTNPQYKLPAGGTPANKPGTIPVTTSGSGGGAGRSTGAAHSNKPKAVQLLDG